MKIALGSDHAGYAYKEIVKKYLIDAGHEVVDFGTDSDESCDYPVFVRPAAEAVGKGECDRCVVFGGSGNGEAMVANRVRGVRCAVCWSEDTARLSREHNNANGLSIGQRTISEEMLVSILNIWLETPFEGGRHERRINLIDE